MVKRILIAIEKKSKRASNKFFCVKSSFKIYKRELYTKGKKTRK